MKILIVEDERRLADSLKALLEKKGFQVEAVYDGETGAEYAELGVYDLLILDVMMPGLDGYELARRVRARRCGVPILMLTARSALEDRVQGLPAGAEKTRDNLYQGRAVHETVILEYRVGTEDSILFTYSRYQNFHGPAEDYTCQETRVAGKPGYLLWSVIDGREDRSSGTLLWYDQDEEMAFGLTYHSAENDVKNELFRIAKSISKIPGAE